MEFEWDTDKTASTFAKHGVGIEEAASAFRDALSSTVPDPLHSGEEERHVLLGTSDKQRLLVVVHTDHDNTTRLISAREATRQERRQYENG